jgi:hypothetical protein
MTVAVGAIKTFFPMIGLRPLWVSIMIFLIKFGGFVKSYISCLRRF